MKNVGRTLILAEADKRFRKEIERIENSLSTVPSPEKFIQSEREMVDRVLHTPQQINLRNDCYVERIKGGFKEWYYACGRFNYPVEYIRQIRHHYRLYLGGIVNFDHSTLTVTDPDTGNELKLGELVIEAVKFYKMEEWLKNYVPEVTIVQKKRTLADIALQFIWENKIISNQNKDEVARTFPELELKNGTKLYLWYNYYAYPTNRTSDQGSYDGKDDDKNRKHLKKMENALLFIKNKAHIEVAELEILTFKKNAKEVSGFIS